MTTNHALNQSERPSGVRRRKPTYVIATEGEKTEPDYFAYLDREYRDVNIIIIPATDGRSQPSQVLNSLLCKKKEFAKTDMNSYQFWIVIDHDGRLRSELESVIQDAEANQVSVADSNPCFEVWLIQHFSALTDIPELSHVKPVKTCGFVTNKHLKSYDPQYKKRCLDDTKYMPKVSAAVQNAEFDEVTANDSDEFIHTGSRVHKLVKQIRSDD